MKFVSIIMTHWSMNPERSDKMHKCIDSLIESIDYPSEIIVVDNGNSETDTAYFHLLCKQKKINVHIMNSKNMHFGFARNQGIAVANGDYICITDNDILYEKGWLSKCIEPLDMFPDEKIYTTPFCDLAHQRFKYWSGELKKGRKTYRLNMRAGSNCFIARRDDFVKIGMFPSHRIAGTKWTNRAVKLGYLAAVVPGDLASDMAFRRGYNLNLGVPISLDLKLGEVFLNIDEFGRDNPNLDYIEQKTVCKSSQ